MIACVCIRGYRRNHHKSINHHSSPNLPLARSQEFNSPLPPNLVSLPIPIPPQLIAPSSREKKSPPRLEPGTKLASWLPPSATCPLSGSGLSRTEASWSFNGELALALALGMLEARSVWLRGWSSMTSWRPGSLLIEEQYGIRRVWGGLLVD